ncbi:MAG: hypothetical protein IK130_09570, partial [Oscillospiraceae bacterium]|nr:hypothetical protein [Oscillospiraceae bacterium]
GEVASNVNIDLVNDIRFNMNLTQKGDGSCEISDNLAWTPISEFSGVFDGKNHTISGIFFNGTEEGGLFHILNGATVKNLSIVDSSFASDAKVGSIAASAKSGTIISNVCSTAAVSGDNAAGLVYNLEESTLTSAFFAGTGTEMLFAPGNEDSVVSNVFILSEDESIPYAASASAIASGSVACALGSAWSQDLEFGDALPYLGTDKRVYSYVQNHSCSLSDPQAETIYTNDAELSGTTQTLEHDLEWGKVVKQATCTENERWNKKCKNCGYETSELFDRMEDGLMATGHNHDSSGYCQNIDPNTGRKCNHYDSSYRVYSLEGASVALAADFSVSGITGRGWRAEDLSAFDITYGTDASHRSEALPTEPGTYYAFVTPNGTNTQYQGIAQSEAVEIYALNVAGQQVTSLIADDILGNGKFSYNKDTKTLQIKASNFNYAGTVIESSIDGLTISADSNVTLMTRSESKDCIILHKNATITGSGLINIIAGSEKAAGTEGGAAIRSDAKLTIKNVGITIVARSCILGGADKAALEIIDSNMNMIAHSDLGAISGFSGYTFTKCEITIPGATEITDGTVMDTTGETPVPAKCVNITAYSSILYDLYIASVQVSRANADDILGDGVLSFDPKTNTLTVNGDCVSEDSEPFIKNQIDGLTIDVVSDSKFSFENCTAITSFGHNLTITGEGKLKIDSQASSISVKQCVLTIKDTELTVCIAGDSVYGITGGLDNDTLEIINSMMCVEADSGAIVNFENGITLEKSMIVKPTNAFISDNAISDADGALASIVKIMPMSIAPEIKTQPQDAIGDVGETAVFTVEATGRSLSFQWQYESAAGWTDSDLTGAKTNKLSVPITAERDGQQYRCVVSNLAGTVNSDSASIHIKAAITADPTDFTGSIGETAKFTVSVSGKNLKYQWQFKDGTTWKDSGMTGAQTAALSVPIIEARDGQQYRCVVSNPAGNVISNPASIHIKAAITADPTDFTGFVGETAKFTVTASGKNLKYQWQFKDGAIWKESSMNGAKNATLSVPIIEARDGQQYRCIVSNSFGSETSDAASIQVKAVITAQPTVQTVELNQTAKFTVAATGTNLIYQWQFLDVNTWRNSGMTGANTATLSVPVTAARDGQQYRCIVKSSNGTSDISSPASIKVKTAITAQPTNQTGKIDSTVKFTVAATGTNLKYQWQFLSTSGWKNSGMTGANTATLSVPVTAARDGQQYRCIVKSSNGTSDISSPASIKVKTAITAQP